MLTRAGLGFDTILFYLSKDRASWAVVVTVSNAVKWSDQPLLLLEKALYNLNLTAMATRPYCNNKNIRR
jgi:hypothetical protein